MTTTETVDYNISIKIEKVNREHLQSVLRDFNDPAASEKDTGNLVVAAYALFSKQKSPLGKCDNCDGKSPDALDACAFCGVGGDGFVEGRKAAEGANGNGSSTAAVTAGRPAVAQTLVRVKRAPKPAEEAVEVTAVVVSAPGTRDKLSRQTATEDDLDQDMQELFILKAEGSLTLWKLGAKIAFMHGKHRWKLRTKEVEKSGKTVRVQAYTSFDEWCVAELGMGHGNAFDLIELNKHFNTDEVRLFGKEKLVLFLKAPEAAKPEIMKEMEQGKLKTTRDVKRRVRAARVAAGTLGKPRDTGRKPMPQPKKRSRGRVSDTLTVSMAKKAVRLRFVTRKTMRAEEPKFAKRIADAPVAKIELGRATVWISLSQDNKGNIVGTMVASRGET